MKTLSMQRPLPSIEIRVPARFSLSVQAKDVNCEPWSVFMIPGAPKRWMASFSASTQKSFDLVLEPVANKVSFQRVRYPPSQHLAGEPVHDGDEIQEAAPHRQVGNVGAPDLTGAIDP